MSDLIFTNKNGSSLLVLCTLFFFFFSPSISALLTFWWICCSKYREKLGIFWNIFGAERENSSNNTVCAAKKCVTEKQDESTKLYLCTFEAVKNQQHFVTPCSPLIFSGKSVFLNRDLKDCAQIIISSPPACLFAKIPLTLNKRKHTLNKEICSLEK